MGDPRRWTTVAMLLLAGAVLAACGSSSTVSSVATAGVSSSTVPSSAALSATAAAPCAPTPTAPTGSLAPSVAPKPAPAARTATFLPETLAVASGRCRIVVLTVTNPDDKAAAAAVQLYADPGLTVSPATSAVIMPAGGSAVVLIGVVRSASAAATSTVTAVVKLTTPGQVATLTAVLPVTLQAANPVVVPVSATAVVSSTGLTEYQSVDAFFTLTNSTDDVVDLSDVVATFPGFVCVAFLPDRFDQRAVNSCNSAGVAAADGRLDVLTGPVPLSAGNSLVVHLRLTAPNGVQPGSGLMVLSGQARDGADGSVRSFMSSQSLTFSVLGQSDILGVLGVPSLILVPGVVVAVTLFLLLTRVYPGRRTGTPAPDLPDLTKTGLWVFALLPSLAFPFLYPSLTELFGRRRDYRTVYGLSDIFIVWALAVGFGFAVWVLIVLIRLAAQRFVIIRPSDLPDQVLFKLARRPRINRYRLMRATLAEKNVFIVHRRQDDSFLVIPPVTWTAVPPADPDELREILVKPTPRNMKKQIRKKQILVEFADGAKPGTAASSDLNTFIGPMNVVSSV